MSYKATRYHAQNQEGRPITAIQHSNGTVLYTRVVLGGQEEVADSAETATAQGRMAELFKHQQPTKLSAASERFLGRGRN